MSSLDFFTPEKLAILESISKWERILKGVFNLFWIPEKCGLCKFVFGKSQSHIIRTRCMAECPLAIYYRDCNDAESTFQKIWTMIRVFDLQNYALTQLPYTRLSVKICNELKVLVKQMVEELRSLDDKY